MEGKDVVIDDAKKLYELAQKKAQERMKAAEQSSIPSIPNTKYKRKKDDFKVNFVNSDNPEAQILKELMDKKERKKKEEEEKEPKPTTPYYIPSGSEEAKRWNQELSYSYDLVSIMYMT